MRREPSLVTETTVLIARVNFVGENLITNLFAESTRPGRAIFARRCDQCFSDRFFRSTLFLAVDHLPPLPPPPPRHCPAPCRERRRDSGFACAGLFCRPRALATTRRLVRLEMNMGVVCACSEGYVLVGHGIMTRLDRNARRSIDRALPPNPSSPSLLFCSRRSCVTSLIIS